MRGKLIPAFTFPYLSGITPAHAGKTGREQSYRRESRDHPRACGENSQTIEEIILTAGSPPRMRGKLAPPLRVLLQPRITPAHAGKTNLQSPSAALQWDHPRACGENFKFTPKSTPTRGSPPRMRGKHFGKGVFPWLILVLSLDPL